MAKKSLKVIFTRQFLTIFSIFRCFDVCFVRPPHISYAQAKISTVWPVFPDYLSTSFGYVLKKYLTFTTYYSFPQKHNLKTTYRNKHNKKQPKISHTYTNNNRSSTYLTLHQSMALLPTSSHNNNIYKCLNYRDLYNFPPSHLP